MTIGGGTIPGITVPIIIGGTPGMIGIMEAAAIFIAAKSIFGLLAAGSSSSFPAQNKTTSKSSTYERHSVICDMIHRKIVH